jgi:hypothetical protein
MIILNIYSLSTRVVIAVLKNMFKFGYGFYVIRRNNAIPSVNGGISASIRSEQSQWTEGHEAVYTIRLYNFIIVYQGASSKPSDKSSANHRKSIPKQDNSYRIIITITAIISVMIFFQNKSGICATETERVGHRCFQI